MSVRHSLLSLLLVGPGGLNPYEVLAQLPDDLREAFEEQDTAALSGILGAMKPEEGRKWLKMCVDSGLWVPAPGSKSLLDEDYTEEEEEVCFRCGRRCIAWFNRLVIICLS